MKFETDKLSNFLYEKYRLNGKQTVLNGFFISVITNGTEGGNYEGKNTKSYEKTDSQIHQDIKNDIQEEIQPYINTFHIDISDKKINTNIKNNIYSLAEKLQKNPYDSTTKGDYYGNSDHYDIHFVSIHDVIHVLKDHLTSDEMETIITTSKNVENMILGENVRELKFKNLQALNEQSTEFQSMSKIAKQNLKEKIKKLEQQINLLNKQFENFETNQQKELNTINQKIQSITNDLGSDYINSKINKTKVKP